MPASTSIYNNVSPTPTRPDTIATAVPDSAPQTVLKEVHPQDNGIEGISPVYSFQTDDYVIGALLFCIFLVVGIIGRSHGFFSKSFKDFFRLYPVSDSNVERTKNELTCRLLLIILTAVSLGVLYYDFLQDTHPDLAGTTTDSPYAVVGITTALMLAFFLIKYMLFSAVNNVFFDRNKCNEWTEAYLLSIVALGLFLLPVMFLVIYTDTSFNTQLVIFLIVISIIEIVLFFRCIRTFFNRAEGFLHLIMYFCTLEIAPALILWRVLFWTNVSLTTNIYL